MRRREFVVLLGSGAAALPFAGVAQKPERIVRVGYLAVTSSPRMEPLDEAFRLGLRELGYIEGKNLHVEYRRADGTTERLSALAAELADLKVDVIVTYASGVQAAVRATTTIPIVMASAADVVRLGLVDGLAHPGGNITGSTFFYPELMAKRLELLKRVTPLITSAGALMPRNSPSNAFVLEEMGRTAEAMKVAFRPITIGGPEELQSAFVELAKQKAGGFVMSDASEIIVHSEAIANLAMKHRLPSVGPLELPRRGGLVGYGVNFLAQWHHAAVFVDKIVRGEKPGDLPIEQATEFKLVLNLKTAQQLNVSVPPILVATADEVIE
jgi:putative tryptophan/tyrosine transport system substrate-binding protein